MAAEQPTRANIQTHIDGQIDGLVTYDVPDFLDDTGDAERVDLAGLDALEAGVVIVQIVGGPGEGGADCTVL